jgi:hypothetical protein
MINDTTALELIDRLRFCGNLHPQLGYPENGLLFFEAATALETAHARIAELEALLPWLSEWNVYEPFYGNYWRWEIAHKDYDGADDANDHRYFHGESKLDVLHQAKTFVDEEDLFNDSGTAPSDEAPGTERK